MLQYTAASPLTLGVENERKEQTMGWADNVMFMVIAICVTVYYIVKLKRTDAAREIEKLGELKTKGLLTEEEFEKQKRKILAD